MRQLLLKITILAFTFVIGISVVLVWQYITTETEQMLPDTSHHQDNSPPVVDSKICELHGVLMHKDYAVIEHGRLIIDYGYFRDKERLFPNSNLWVAHDHEIAGQESIKVDVCSMCRQAETLWNAQKIETNTRRKR